MGLEQSCELAYGRGVANNQLGQLQLGWAWQQATIAQKAGQITQLLRMEKQGLIDLTRPLCWPAQPGFKANCSALPRHSETLYTRLVVPAKVHRNSLPIVDDTWISQWVLGSQISKQVDVVPTYLKTRLPVAGTHLIFHTPWISSAYQGIQDCRLEDFQDVIWIIFSYLGGKKIWYFFFVPILRKEQGCQKADRGTIQRCYQYQMTL